MKSRIFPLILFALICSALAGAYLWKTRSSGTPTRAAAAESESLVTVKKKKEAPPAHRLPDLNESYCLDPHATTCATGWPSIDPTGRVLSDAAGEIRALRVMRNIIRENPTWTSEQVQDALITIIYSEKRRTRFKDSFEWVKTALTNFIKEQPATVFSDSEKTTLLDRLAVIELQLPPPAAVYADAMDLVTKNTVYYERTPQGQMRLRLGGAYLLNTSSWYNMIFTLGHEMAHAIDPCETYQADITPKIYGELVACFVDAGWVAPDRSECGPEEQVSEVFADWIASELMGKALKVATKDYSSTDRTRAAINATRDLCDQASTEDSLDLSLHQQPRIRIGDIMGKNPSVRHTLKCEPKKNDSRYCRFNTLPSALSSKETTR
ncbi:hypothetical protein D3C87_125860 [compost metagenome]